MGEMKLEIQPLNIGSRDKLIQIGTILDDVILDLIPFEKSDILKTEFLLIINELRVCRRELKGFYEKHFPFIYQLKENTTS